MGVKKGGKSKGNVSAGIHSNVSRGTRQAMRKEYLASGQRIINQIDAYKKGKNVVLTIPNPNTNETNRPFIRVNAKNYWRDKLD